MVGENEYKRRDIVAQTRAGSLTRKWVFRSPSIQNPVVINFNFRPTSRKMLPKVCWRTRVQAWALSNQKFKNGKRNSRYVLKS